MNHSCAPVSSKIADMLFYEDPCDGNRRVSSTFHGSRPAMRAEAMAASLAVAAIAALMIPLRHVRVCRGSRPAKAKAGLAR